MPGQGTAGPATTLSLLLFCLEHQIERPVPVPLVRGANMLPLHVSLVALPDAVISTLSSIYDVLNSFGILADHDDALPGEPPVGVDIVRAKHVPDFIIVPSVIVGADGWRGNRYPDMVAWLRNMYGGGAILCSACSGGFLIAETGLLDGQETTVHWA